MESLKEKTAKGLFWGGMNNGVQQLLGLAFGIILGRLLDPSDYGMTAMLAVFSVIANELQSSGFKTGLINMKAPKHEDYNAVFWFNILAGAFIYVVLWFCAPLIADYYDRYDGDTHVEYRQCDTGDTGLWLLGLGDAVSDVYRCQYLAVMVFQPLAPHLPRDF